ncbi:helix-turn-helix domain-containing protein [Xenophilus aerolatus]
MFDAQCGERLRQERDRLGLSQQALADLIGVQRAMLSRYERGVAEPGASALMKLAGAGINVSFVLFGAQVATGNDSGTTTRVLTPEQAALLDNYEAADERGRAAARGVLDALAKQKAA